MAKRIIIVISMLAFLLASFSLQAFAFNPYSFDLKDYPSFNLFPYPYQDTTKTVNGVTFTDNGDGTITANGTATADAVFVLHNSGFTYSERSYFSGVPEGASADTFYIRNIDSGGNYYAAGGSLPLRSNGGSYTRFQIVIKQGYTCEGLTFKPMVNVGNVAYPFTPYFPYFLQSPDLDGYDKGYQDGVASLQNSLLGVYQKAQFSYVLLEYPGFEIGEQPWCDPIPFEPVIENGRISFSNLPGIILSAFPEAADWNYDLRVRIYLNFLEEDHFDFFAQPFSVNNSDLVSACSVASADSERYSLYPSESNKNLFTFASDANVSSDFNVSEICFFLKNPLITLSSFYIEPHGTYEDGYKAGVLKGSTVATSDIYEQAYAIGKSDGYLAGKKDGMALNENGSWLSLITAVVEVPINSLMSLLSFEVLGLDMRTAFGSILSICLLLILIKKVIR